MKALVRFVCPECGTVVYAVPTARVHHVCRHRKPRPAFTEFEVKQA